MSNRPSVLLTSRIPQPGIDLLEEHADLFINQHENIMSKQEILTEISDKDGLICMLNNHIDAEIINAGKQLKVIGNYAVGYNNIDIKEATKCKIPVTNTPGVLTEATADLTFALLLSIARRIVEADGYTRRKLFKSWSPMLFLGTDVYGKTLGIIGFGRIGQAVAKRAKGFNMEVLYYDINRLSKKDEVTSQAEYRELDDLLKVADYICIHVPLNRQTYHMITKEKFALMKKSAYLVNVARGPVIDEQALVQALQKKMIAGCALDVYENEPVINRKLLKMANTVLVPHIGSASVETRTNMALIVAKSVISILIDHKKAPNTVNPEAYK